MEDAAYRLVMHMGPDPGAAYSLREEITQLGRDESNDIVINDPEISRHHIRISRTDRGFILEDMGSTNGTFVNDVLLTEPYLLHHGDRISLSDHVTLAFEGLTAEADMTQATAAVDEGTAPQLPAQRGGSRQRTSAPRRARRGSLVPWGYAGCGCLIFLVGAAAILYWMPASWWCLILSPLENVGLSFGGC